MIGLLMNSVMIDVLRFFDSVEVRISVLLSMMFSLFVIRVLMR